MFNSTANKSTKFTFAWLLTVVLLFTTAVNAVAAGYPTASQRGVAPESYQGAYIIDAGAVTGTATTQTIAQGIKPYGLIYALVKAKVPVKWIINPNKTDAVTNATLTSVNQTTGNSGVDFTYDCDGAGAGVAKKYRTGAFVIPKEFAQQASSIVTTWRAKGVTVDGPCVADTGSLPVYGTIAGWPKAILDAQNGSVAVAYFNNAEIPAPPTTINPMDPPAYRFAAPSQLTACDDIYIMPHADPTWATHKELLPFVNAGGSFYASCHAVSEVENMENPAAPGVKVMNFLTTGGMIHYSQHSQGSVPYAFFKSSTDSTAWKNSSAANIDELPVGDPVAQFLGTTDAATQAGSEQIFIPKSGSAYRPTTQLITYDPTWTNSSSGGQATATSGPASSLMYGPAFGDKGLVMYEGGHSVNKGTTADVAAQRAFFNFLLLSAVDRRINQNDVSRSPKVVVTEPAAGTAIQGGQSVAVKGAATGGSGSYNYTWSAACYDRATGAAVSTPDTLFANKNAPNTTFTAPGANTSVNCNMTLTVVDTCGRYSFGYSSVIFAPAADVQVTQTPSVSTTGVGGSVTYDIQVKNNGGPASASNNATEVKLTQQIPAGFEWVETNAPAGVTCTSSNAAVVCDLGTMAKDAIKNISITLRVAAGQGGATLNVTSTVSASSADHVLANNTDTDALLVSASGIAIEISADSVQVNASTGGPVLFTYKVTNISTGTTAAAGLSIAAGAVKDNNGTPSDPSDDITLVYVSGDADTDNKLDTNETWIYRKDVNSANSSINISSASGDDGNPDNSAATKRRTASVSATDSASVVVNASAEATVQLVTASLRATKTADSGKVASGGTAYFTLSVENTSDGPATFRQIAITDTFTGSGTMTCASGGTDLVVTTSGQVSTIKESTAVAYAIASLEKGAIWTARCKVVGVAGAANATLTNTFTATAANPLSGGSGNISNTSSPASITIAPPVFAINKKADFTTARPGKALNYLIDIVNNSGATQSHVKVTDPIPAGLTLPTDPTARKVYVYRSSTTGAATAEIGVLATDKFYSNSSSGGSGWATDWLKSSNVSFTSNYARFNVQSTTNSTENISRTVNFNKFKSNSAVVFECWTSSSNSNAVTQSITASISGGAAPASVSQDCTSTRKMVTFSIPNGSLPTSTGNTALTIKFEAKSTGSSKTVYVDDVQVISGVIAGHSFGNLTSSFSTSNDGFGFDSAWVKGGSETGNIKPTYDSASDKSGYGTSVYWKSGKGSNATGSISRTLKISAADYESAKLSFSCKADSSSSFGYIKAYVNSTVVFTETNSNRVCNNSSSSSAQFTQVSPVTIDPSLFGDTVTLKFEFKGDKSAYIDDIMVLGQVKGSGSGVPTEYASLSLALANEWTLAPGEKLSIAYQASVMLPYPNNTDTDVLNTASVCVVSSGSCTETSSSTSAVGLAIAGFKVEKTASSSVIKSGSSVTYTYKVYNTGTSEIDSVTLSDDLASPSIVPTYVSGDVTSSTNSVRDNILQPGEVWTYNYTASNVTADQNGTVTLDGQERIWEEQFDATTGASTGFIWVYYPLDATTAQAAVTVVNPVLVINSWVDRTSPQTLTTSVRSGAQVTYKFTAATGNATALKNVTISHEDCINVQYVSGDTNSDRILQQSETWSYICVSAPMTQSVTKGAGIKASATDTQAGFSTEPTPLAYAITVVQPVSLKVVKTAAQTAAVTSSVSGSTLTTVASNSVRYTYHVTSNDGIGSNPGPAGTSISGINVTDDGCSPITAVLASGQNYNVGDLNGNGKLDPNEDWEFTCNAGEVLLTSSSNSAANGTDVTGGTVNSPYVTYNVIVQKPSLRLEVKSNKEYAKYNTSVTFTYTVTNDGETSFDYRDVTPNSAVCSPISQVLVSGKNAGDTNANGYINPGEVWQYTCTLANVTTDVEEHFTVGLPNNAGFTPVESIVRIFVIDPNLVVTQVATAIDPISNSVRMGPAREVDAEIGDTIKYDYTISSSATQHASSITGLNVWLVNELNDAKCSPITAVLSNGHNAGDNGSGDASLDNNDQLDPGESWQFTCSTTQLTQTAAVVDAAVVVSAATVADNFTVTAPTARVRIASVQSNLPLGGGGTVVVTPTPTKSPTPTPTPSPSTPSGTVTETPTQLSATVYFTGDSAVLTTKTSATLKTFAAKIKKVKKTAVIKIYGWVKETPDKSYDTRLATARATNVMKKLKALGVKGKFTVVAKGIHDQKNPTARRVEVFVRFTK